MAQATDGSVEIQGNLNQPDASAFMSFGSADRVIIQYAPGTSAGADAVIRNYLASTYTGGDWGIAEGIELGESTAPLVVNTDIQPASVPEPGSVCVLGAWALGMLGQRRRR